MAKLTKQQRKLHSEAEALISLERKLTDEETQFVFENWHEGADFNNGASGAFFTPFNLARDFSLDAGSGRIIDLCAGIGALAYCTYHRNKYGQPTELTCIERNPRYLEVGKKLLPEARWIQADVFDWRDWFFDELEGKRFDCAIGNPPFGKVRRSGDAPRYTGADFEYHVIDIASEIADFGSFIVPQQSANFRYSGAPCFTRVEDGKAARFTKQTGLNMDIGVGVDCGQFAKDWKDTTIITEIVCFDFATDRAERLKKQVSLTAAPAPTISRAPAQQLAFF